MSLLKKIDVMSVLKAFDKNAERWSLLVFYSMLVITMFVEVLRREVFAYSSIWGEEIVRYAFIYLAWVGAASAVKERGHIRIDVIMQYASRRVKAVLYMFGDVVMAIVALVALYTSWHAVEVSWTFNSVSHGLRISMVWFLLAVPLGFALVMLRLIQSFSRDYDDFQAGRPVYEGDKLFD